MKFRYMDKVKVIDGFYKGKKGVVRATISIFYLFRTYLISFEGFNSGWVKENDLRRID
jgi:ribosomal protein L24